MNEPALNVENLRVTLDGERATSTPVDGVSLKVERGEALGIVGESGSGKSLTLRAILGLVPPSAEVTGDVRVGTVDTTPSRSPHIGRDGVGMIFQEPMTALNPTMRVGDLVAEGVRAKRGGSPRDARREAVELLRQAGVREPETRARMWPHQLSGGQRQRVMIAAALSTEPDLLLCDEPTTALDVTVQNRILELLGRLRTELGMTIVFVSHDLAVVAELCDRIAVMYAGQIVEIASADELLAAPRHPYTAALIRSAPSFHDRSHRLMGIAGSPPDPVAFPDGCRFASRCEFARDDCREMTYRLLEREDRSTACIHSDLLDEVHS